jgi:dihydrofolate synthase/folylpolyglutamate synthase
MKRSSYKTTLGFLFGLEKSGIKLGLERTVDLLEAAGNPHRSFKSIHIAGTNGKGSVACYLNSILFQSGRRTGLFTSPHLVDYRERIRIDGEVIGRAELVDLVARLRASILEIGASYFEATTVLAFLCFAAHRADVAVVEVGMGGRLDSTNVLSPVVSCITSIGFDHVKYLGRTLARIAGEKAGIIKPGVPVVCGRLSGRASAAVRSAAASSKSDVFEMGKDASFRPIEMGMEGSTIEYSGLSGALTFRLKSPGLHHAANAATAVLAVEVLRERGFEIDDRSLREGLLAADWPGRLQVLRRRPLVICDAAHNVSGTRLLARSLEVLGLDGLVTVFGVLRDKEYREMLDLLAGSTSRFVLTRPDSDRALPFAGLESAARKLDVPFTTVPTVEGAVKRALKDVRPGGGVLICGSLYTLGEAMQALGYRPHRARVC